MTKDELLMFWQESDYNREDFIKERTKNLIVGKKRKITQYLKIREKTQPDLFGFAYKDIDDKIKKYQEDIVALENGTYNIWAPPMYVNNIKWYLSDEAKECYQRHLKMEKLVKERNEAVLNDNIQLADSLWKEIEEIVEINFKINNRFRL